jgi:hypothetical protein
MNQTPQPEFRFVPCNEVNPYAKKMADAFEQAAIRGPSIYLSDEAFAGAITMCGQTLAELLIRMMKRRNFWEAWTAMTALGEMIGNLLKAAAVKKQGGIVLAKGLLTDEKQFYKES